MPYIVSPLFVVHFWKSIILFLCISIIIIIYVGLNLQNASTSKRIMLTFRLKVVKYILPLSVPVSYDLCTVVYIFQIKRFIKRTRSRILWCVYIYICTYEACIYSMRRRLKKNLHYVWKCGIIVRYYIFYFSTKLFLTMDVQGK